MGGETKPTMANAASASYPQLATRSSDRWVRGSPSDLKSPSSSETDETLLILPPHL